jgi:hypothetical protein
MRKILVLATAAMLVALGGVTISAAPLPGPSWRLHAKIGRQAGHPAIRREPMTEGRAAYTIVSPGKNLNDYYRDVGLSNDPEDCNKGCALSNGP